MDIYDKYDERLRNRWRGDDEDDEDRVLPDGHTIRVPLVLMDGKTVKDQPAPFQHADRRPRELPITDAERERRQKAVADYNARVSNAWRNPPEADQ
jgi:hypothetical protein